MTNTLKSQAVSLIWCNALAFYTQLYGPSGEGAMSPEVNAWLTSDPNHWAFVLAVSGLDKCGGIVSFYDDETDMEDIGDGPIKITYNASYGVSGGAAVYAVWSPDR